MVTMGYRSADMVTDENLQKTLNWDYAVFGSYGLVALHYDISKALTYRIIKEGYIPKREDIRAKLGMTSYYPAEACARCGAVHTTKRCVKSNGSKRSPRLSISLVNPEHAARSITNNMGVGLRKELIKLLEGKINTTKERDAISQKEV